LRSDLITARLDAARLRAALSDGSDPLADFDPPGEASPALIAMQRQFLIDQTSEHRAKLAALDRQKAQKEAERATIAATVGKSTRYGLLHGQVASVSQDAITRDTPQDKDSGRAHNADSSTSEPKGQELAYAARVSLDADAGGEQHSQLVARHGGHGGDQDRVTPGHQLSAFAPAEVQAGDPAGEMSHASARGMRQFLKSVESWRPP
jgi:hypothetical protein